MILTLTLILIEDEAELLELFTCWFSSCGYHCIGATNIAEARQILQQATENHLVIDAVLSDCRMPTTAEFNQVDMAPQALFEELQQLASIGTKIVITSADHTFRQDASIYLSKKQIPHTVVPKDNLEKITQAISSRKVA